MASHGLRTVSSFLLALVWFGCCDGARVTPDKPTSMEFLRSSCRATMYPALCFNSLSAYAGTIQTSPMKLAHTALFVSLDGALSASAAMKTMSSGGGMSRREAGAMGDCVEVVGDSVDSLQASMRAMRHLGGTDLGYQLSNIQTWVSAAITDVNTCMDGFSGSAMNGGVKSAVRSWLVSVDQLTSNALAFINGLVSPSDASGPSPNEQGEKQQSGGGPG